MKVRGKEERRVLLACAKSVWSDECITTQDREGDGYKTFGVGDSLPSR
jgi:hypothetical protein